jgi:hypothetical protein
MHGELLCGSTPKAKFQSSFVIARSSEEWREDVLADVTELDWSDLEADAGYALLRW